MMRELTQTSLDNLPWGTEEFLHQGFSNGAGSQRLLTWILPAHESVTTPSTYSFKRLSFVLIFKALCVCPLLDRPRRAFATISPIIPYTNTQHVVTLVSSSSQSTK